MPPSRSTVARALRPSPNTCALLTSTILNRMGPSVSTDSFARGGRSNVTTARSRSAEGLLGASSSGTTWAPVPLVSVSRIQVFPIKFNLRLAGALDPPHGRWHTNATDGSRWHDHRLFELRHEEPRSSNFHGPAAL